VAERRERYEERDMAERITQRIKRYDRKDNAEKK
jgi:hypothetical protein